MIAYKFLRRGRIGPFSGVRWPDPAQDRSWVAANELGAVSACRLEDLPEWPDDELWRVELAGGIHVEAGKLAAARGRLVERVHAWDAAVAAELAAACALRARDAALTMLNPDDAATAALRRCNSPLQIVEVVDSITGLGDSGTDAVHRAADAARAAIIAREQPPSASPAAAEAAFIASHVAAHAAGDVAAAPRERAWQAAWLAERLALGPT